MRKQAVLVLLLLGCVVPAGLADSLEGKIAVGASVGYFMPQDDQGEGFRFGLVTPAGISTIGFGEKQVDMDPGLRWSVSVLYGLKERWSLQLEFARYEEGIGKEVVLQDPDASTATFRPVWSPSSGITYLEPGITQDEEIFTLPVGEITLSPVSFSVLRHWGVRRKTSVYFGGGPTYVFIKYDTHPLFRDFVGYSDGIVDDSLGLNIKGGLQVALTKRWFFELGMDYLLVDKPFRWRGVDRTFGEQSLDLNEDGVPDVFGLPADRRVVDPGTFRYDGLTFNLGVRLAFPLPERSKGAESEAQ